jgi:glucose-6-phosphate 1-dehydrogenase
MSDLSSHLFVIFGATGDLTHRKLLPALIKLMIGQSDAPTCLILGASGSDWNDAKFRETARAALAQKGFSDETVRAWTDRHLFYTSLGRARDDYGGLKARIEALEAEHGLPGNRVFYLSVPPPTYPGTIEQLGRCGLNASAGWTRLVIEKPFGRDLASARALNALVHRYFNEDQVYRIDHYLGKETVQNLLAFRFANILFESVWNRDRIERVEITVAESLGLGSRAGYYDRAGAFRDMIQNHLTQLFTLVAMEVPSGFNAEAIRQEKIKVLKSVQSIDPERDVIFGQYAAGRINGEQVPGYLDEAGIDGVSHRQAPGGTPDADRRALSRGAGFAIPDLCRHVRPQPQHALDHAPAQRRLRPALRRKDARRAV